jgi:hypothetical protein
MGFTPILVTGTYLLPTGQPVSGSISFTPTAVMRDPFTNTNISTNERVAALDENGHFQIQLFATNDVGIEPNGVTYEVNERFRNTSYNKYFISLDYLSPDGLVDIADIVPNVEPITTYNYATVEYVDQMAGRAEHTQFIPTDEILSTNVQAAIEEVRELSRYVHTQLSASQTWTINHNMRFHPSVSIVDTGDTHIIGEITYTTLNQVIVTFTSPFSGKAYLS